LIWRLADEVLKHDLQAGIVTTAAAAAARSSSNQ